MDLIVKKDVGKLRLDFAREVSLKIKKVIPNVRNEGYLCGEQDLYVDKVIKEDKYFSWFPWIPYSIGDTEKITILDFESLASWYDDPKLKILVRRTQYAQKLKIIIGQTSKLKRYKDLQIVLIEQV